MDYYFTARLNENYQLIKIINMYLLSTNNRKVYKILLLIINKHFENLKNIEKEFINHINKKESIDKLNSINNYYCNTLKQVYNNFTHIAEKIIFQDYFSILYFVWLNNLDILNNLDKDIKDILQEYFPLYKKFLLFSNEKKFSFDIFEFDHQNDMIKYHLNRSIMELDENITKNHKKLFRDTIKNNFLLAEKIF